MPKRECADGGGGRPHLSIRATDTRPERDPLDLCVGGAGRRVGLQQSAVGRACAHDGRAVHEPDFVGWGKWPTGHDGDSGVQDLRVM